jgi:hypothetical protein
MSVAHAQFVRQASISYYAEIELNFSAPLEGAGTAKPVLGRVAPVQFSILFFITTKEESIKIGHSRFF